MKVTVEDGKERVTIEGGHAKAAGRWDGEHVAGVIVKSSAELQQTLTVAYPANRPDAARAADGHRDFASPEAVRKAAHSFLVNSPKVGLHHADGTDGAGTVVESYTWPGPDWTPEGSGYTVREGDWLVKVQWSDDAWKLIKSGEIGGVSMQGRARRAKADPEKVAGLRS